MCMNSPIKRPEDLPYDLPYYEKPVLYSGSPMGIEARRERRVKVTWPARVQLPDGKVVELKLRDLSEHGVGLLSDVRLPLNVTMNLAVGVPYIQEPSRIVPVVGTVTLKQQVLQGHHMSSGGIWVSLPSDGQELLKKWIRKLTPNT